MKHFWGGYLLGLVVFAPQVDWDGGLANALGFLLFLFPLCGLAAWLLLP